LLLFPCSLLVQLNFGSHYLATDVITESNSVWCAHGAAVATSLRPQLHNHTTPSLA
jgi:hypothetical protein